MSKVLLALLVSALCLTLALAVSNAAMESKAKNMIKVLGGDLWLPASRTWRGDLETGDFSQWRYLHIKDTNRARVVTDRVREGKYAARYEVRPGDVQPNMSGERAEAYVLTDEIAGVESWWTWSTYFGDDFVPNPNARWNFFTQWHNEGKTGQPNIAFLIDSNFNPPKIVLRTMGGTENDDHELYFTLSSLTRNKWYDFIFHVRWDNDGKGFIELWLNGEHVVGKTNTPTTYVGQGVYLKQGYYRGTSDLTSVIYHDGMRRGTSYDDMIHKGPAQPNSCPSPAACKGGDGKSHSGLFYSGKFARCAKQKRKTVCVSRDLPQDGHRGSVYLHEAARLYLSVLRLKGKVSAKVFLDERYAACVAKTFGATQLVKPCTSSFMNTVKKILKHHPYKLA